MGRADRWPRATFAIPTRNRAPTRARPPRRAQLARRRHVRACEAQARHARRPPEVTAIARRSRPTRQPSIAAHRVQTGERVGPYRTPVPPPTPPSAPASGHASALVALFGLLLIVLAIRAAGRESSPLARLPTGERQRLYERTLENLALCERHDDAALRSFCEAQAQTARALPECGAECRALTRSRYPSRARTSCP